VNFSLSAKVLSSPRFAELSGSQSPEPAKHF
jgi:hypothetical protein